MVFTSIRPVIPDTAIKEVWRWFAENVLIVVKKGMRVFAHGIKLFFGVSTFSLWFASIHTNPIDTRRIVIFLEEKFLFSQDKAFYPAIVVEVRDNLLGCTPVQDEMVG